MDDKEKLESGATANEESGKAETETTTTTNDGDLSALTDKLTQLADQVRELAAKNAELQRVNAAMLNSISARDKAPEDALKAFVEQGR